MIFNKAPISEVIFGVAFNKPLKNVTEIVDFYCSNYKTSFPILELSNPIADVIIHENDKTEVSLNPNLTGQAIFRFRSEDKHYLLQIQKNKLYFNWIRQDDELTGNYPGFSDLYSKFINITNELKKGYFNNNDNFYKSFDLTYHDRFKINDFLSGNLDKILKINIKNYGDKILHFSDKTTEIINVISSRCTRNIETLFNQQNEKLLRFECTMQSFDNNKLTLEKWFKKAHELQNKIFIDTFNEDLLKLWN